MEILPVQAKLNTDVKADVTPAIQETASVIGFFRKGIGKVLNACAGVWIAGRERIIALLQAQTERDCKMIADGSLVYREGKLIPTPDPLPGSNVYTVLHELNHQGDAKRLEQAILEAARQLSGIPDDEISDEPLSQTFFNRWRREAEMIDEDDLRALWAGILKEEVIKAGSISPKTLDVIKDLSRQDCETFLRICRGSVKGEIIVDVDNQPVFGTYQDITLLQDVGLVNQMEASVKVATDHDTNEALFRFAGSKLVIRISTASFWARTFSITRAGRELLRVLGEPMRSDSDVVAIQRCFVESTLERFSSQVVQSPTEGEASPWEWIRGSRPASFA